jgi:hypothetical protein
VRVFVERVGELERLDVAVLNAGWFKVRYGVGRYGWRRHCKLMWCRLL